MGARAWSDFAFLQSAVLMPTNDELYFSSFALF